MPLTLKLRGAVFYVRGSVSVGDQTQRVYQSTGLSDERQAEIYRAKLETRIIEALLYGEKHAVTLEEAAGAYGAAGGSARFLGPVLDSLGHRLLRTLSQADVDQAARETYPNVTPETLNRQFYTPFIAVWNYAESSGWAEPRKWRRPRKPKGSNVVSLKRERAGTAATDYETAGRFVSAMSPAPAQVMTAIFFHGFRPIEVFLMTAEDVSVENRWIIVRRSKIGEARGVPMHEFTVPMWRSLVARGGTLFRTRHGEPYPVSDEGGGQIDTAIKGARARTKISGISPYTGRHTVSTQLVINGVHPHVKDQILGHAVDDMSRHYTHVPQKQLIEAINTIEAPDSWQLPWLAEAAGWQRKLLPWTEDQRTKLRANRGQSAGARPKNAGAA